jgi:hypothetical protein
MAIFRVFSGADGQSHFEDIEPQLRAAVDQSEKAELVPGSGILLRRFEPSCTNSCITHQGASPS